MEVASQVADTHVVSIKTLREHQQFGPIEMVIFAVDAMA